MKGMMLFMASSAVLIVLIAWLMGMGFETPADHRAIVISAVVAYVIQLFTFAIVRTTRRQNVMAGWGIGVILRFVTLIAYGFLILKPYGLPVLSAMVSLAAFLFLSTLIEPVMLAKS
ncbi:MAG TPA: hypothetical protein VFW98_02675 [Gemmatimonadaceae bacterium]|nr:hypothetical protein [Gemmatimonadaceae bacterium]